MTEDQDQGNAAPRDAESRGCLLLLASYADVAEALQPAVTSIATRILASPVLGDFVELRFVDVGIRPDPGVSSTAPARILDALAHPGAEAAQTYFALVFADQSAAGAAGVLQECRSDPVLAGLPLEYRGLAVIEDRAAAAGDDGIVVAASGKWTARTLAEELLRYAEQLYRFFGTTHERGATRNDLAAIRAVLQQANTAPAPSAVAADDAETDLLAVVPVPRSQGDSSRSDEPAAIPAASAAADQEPSGGAAQLWLRLPRWRLAPSRRKAAESASPPAVESARLAVTGTGPPLPVFMLLHGDKDPDEHSSWRRGRSVMTDVDRGLAGARPGAFKVRAFSGKGGLVKTPLSDAGSLSPRDIKRPDPSYELAPSLRYMHSALRKDSNVLGLAADPAVLPVVVIFAVEIPVADVITADAYIDLALDTMIIWVVPAGGNGLLSQTFSTSESHILTDHDEVADDIVTLVLASATPREAAAARDPAGDTGTSTPAGFIVGNRGRDPGARLM